MHLVAGGALAKAKTKTCQKCGVERAAKAYYMDRGRARVVCIPCVNARNNARTVRMREEFERGARQHPAAKTCVRCKKTKASRLFSKSYNNADGLGSYCTDCHSWNIAERRYGLSKAELKEMLRSQEGKCAGCSKAISLRSRTTHVDHCHVSSRVRGILCRACNVTLGHARDCKARLAGLIDYLSRWESKTAPAPALEAPTSSLPDVKFTYS